jgi:endo-1,4-beta-D-glucanase Y
MAYRRALALAVFCSLLGACAKSPMPVGDGSGGDGPNGTGGATGSGGAIGSGGAATGGAVGTGGDSGLILGMGGPFPFPQNKKPPNCTLTTVANASASVQAAYNSWKGSFVTPSGAGLRVRWPNSPEGDITVSEGIAYGMLAAVYMADRPTFDGLWTYAKAHFDTKGLMNWKIGAGENVLGAGSASDGDEDMAWALLMASNQWSSATYLTDARAVINAMYTNSIAGDGMLKPGDNWGGADPSTYPDYFSPAYFRVFAAVTNNPNWRGAIIDRNYAILMNVSGTYGLVPDKTTATYQNMGDYGYDACRTPWRIGMDYCFNGEPRAQAYLTKIGAFFNNVGAANIGDGYSLTGSQTSSNRNMAFIGPAGVAGIAGYQSLLDGAFMYGATNNGGDGAYFPQSLRVVTMLMMSGNFVDFTKP